MRRVKRLRALLVAVSAGLAAALVPAVPASADEIVFICGRDVCTMNPDSPSSLANLTQTGSFTEKSPAWSPNGQRIAYAADYGGTTNGREIWTIPTTPLGEAINVSETTDRFEDGPVWSPDSSRLSYDAHYFSSAPPNLGNDVNVAPQDGTAAPWAIGSSTDQEHVSTWSPNGSLIAFDRRGSQNGIFIGNSDGSGTPALLNGGALGLNPEWSPDGTRIAALHTSIGPGPYTVRVIRADGSGTYVDLGTSPGGINDVVWSPDSTRVAWIDGYNDKIFVRVADGSAPAIPIRHPNEAIPQNIVWSPDGTRVAFNDYVPGPNPENFGIWVAPADGSADAVMVTNPATHSEDPFWKPGPFIGPTPPGPGPPTAPPTATRKPATVNLARLEARGPINPFRPIAFINCHVDGYPPSNHPACRAFADGYTRGARAPGGRLASRAGKRVLVVTARLTIPAGETRKLKLKLTKAGRKLLKPGKTVRVQLTVKVRQAGNRTVNKTKTVKLRVPGRK